MIKKCFLLLLVIIFLVSSSFAAGRSATDNVLNIAVKQGGHNDWYFSSLRMTVVLGHHLYDTLLYRNINTQEYEPLLAKSYKFIDDKTLEFQLRGDVKFHNGDEFDADDVVYTINWISNPDNKVQNQRIVSWIARGEKISKYKVRIYMKKPFPAAIEYLAGSIPIYPKKYHSSVGPEGMEKLPIGTGPYKYGESNEKPDTAIYVKNESYFNNSPKGKPKINKLVIHKVPDLTYQISGLKAGRFDWIWKVDEGLVSELIGYSNIKVVNQQTMRIGYLSFASAKQIDKKSPVMKKKVRQAIAHAVNRKRIIRDFVKGNSKIVHSACFPTQIGCTDEVVKYKYDKAIAKKLLNEVGYPNGFKIDLFAYRNRPFANEIIKDLREIGIDANLHYLKYAACRDAVRNNQVEITFMTWGSWSLNDVSASTSYFFKGSSDDITQDEEIQNWLTIADNSIDINIRKKNYKKALQKIAKEVYWLPLWTYNYNYAFSKSLNFEAPIDEIPRFFNAKWR
jgi:peptide/nickel transport system substrate-binding protein